ncbi:hypothetical protein [Streptomyces chrestomyceticus]|uniref:hypothetical protein n=1 Tax=Streptomyces chrestomyceticus TaxID=68185 RepID=UPI0037A9C487
MRTVKTDFPYHPSQDRRGDRLTPPVAERNARRSRGVAGRIVWAHSLWIDPELERLYGGDRHAPDVNRERAVRLSDGRLDPLAMRPLDSLVSVTGPFLSRHTSTVGVDPADEAFDLVRRTHSGYLCELAIGVIRPGSPQRGVTPSGPDHRERSPFTAVVPRDHDAVSRAAGLLESSANELLSQWYEAFTHARGTTHGILLPPLRWAQGVFALSIRYEYCRRVRDEPGFTAGERQHAGLLLDEVTEALPQPGAFRDSLPGGVQGSVVNELLSCSYPLWDRVRFCLDSPFDGLRSLAEHSTA